MCQKVGQMSPVPSQCWLGRVWVDEIDPGKILGPVDTCINLSHITSNKCLIKWSVKWYVKVADKYKTTKMSMLMLYFYISFNVILLIKIYFELFKILVFILFFCLM